MCHNVATYSQNGDNYLEGTIACLTHRRKSLTIFVNTLLSKMVPHLFRDTVILVHFYAVCFVALLSCKS